MNCSESELFSELTAIVGEQWLKTSPADLTNFGSDWTKAYEAKPIAIVFPGDIDSVVAIVKLANLQQIALVPSGGRTGLSGGAVAANGELVVAFDRMNKILDFDPADRQAVCEPGVITEQLQQFADDKGLFYPVDFASSGSSQLGGNASTNAGGIKVIRYGMTRDWVKGLKVVTGAGDVLNLNRGLAKNATGYDLRHLFVGSEGTLGFIVELTLGLESKPHDPTVLVLGVEDMSATMHVLKAFQEGLTLTAFEFFSDKALKHVMSEKGLQAPFETECEYYTLIEFESLSENDLDTAMTLFESCMESGWIVDGTISQNSSQAKNLWRLREDISETISRYTPYKNDISVKVSRVPDFLKEVDELVSAAYPDFEIIWFGHIGDGNVHLNILKPEELAAKSFFEKCAKVSDLVFTIVQKYGGSISAEHGVGLLKKPFLHYSCSPAEIAYMKAIKKTFDPNSIMNPGKLFDQ
ncbi:MAG: FAD-binding oxidoreductase [SAR86 cluster bacterium]|uniref:D-2-hydroxyglutarate dehydrogenase n=1 Tax=SAR86 cluster bacterium TaxID=2030880 RepID=A0A2A5B8T3_9GAMM|nr:MAG: FAD-binding oxidoreductase [SAR86 cluster bacterium]